MDACPPLEDIAAFLDGTLSPEERARITEHLARCESCYEVFVGAVDFLEEKDDDEDDVAALVSASANEVIQFPFAPEKNQETKSQAEPARPPRRASQWLPLAASVVLAVGLGWVGWKWFIAPPEITLAAVLEPIEKKVEAGDLYSPEAERGIGDDAPLLPFTPSFMAGVHVLDLRLSVQAGDVKATGDHLQALGAELQGPFMDPALGERYQKEYVSMETSEDLDRFRRKLPELDGRLQDVFQDSISYQFGLWAEAGRLAAKTKAPEFFERRDNRRFLSRIQKAFPEEEFPELEEPVLRELGAIERIWDEGNLSDQRLDDLARHFQSTIELIDRYEDHLGEGE